MEDKKAKFIIYICIALIAFICSSAVYSMTGGLSDWIVVIWIVQKEEGSSHSIQMTMTIPMTMENQE